MPYSRYLYAILFLVLLMAAPAVAQETMTAHLDTLVVATDRVSVEEVLWQIIRREEADMAAMQDYEYTSLTTMVMWDEDDPDSDHTIEEYAFRFHRDRIDGEQIAQLWNRKRKYENGELVDDETDTEVQSEWLDAEESFVAVLPFEREGVKKYNYEILDRLNVGNSLVYKIGYEPKSKFDALPTGVIWVDYSNWVIRKVDASMTGAVPYPMFIESMPYFRLSQERFGEYWFPSDMHIKMRFRSLPLLPIPKIFEVRVELTDVVINGVPQSAEDAVPEDGPELSAAESAFWMTAEESADSLSAFWQGIGQEWKSTMAPELEPITLSQVAIDSLTEVGVTELTTLREGGAWKMALPAIVAPEYNRVQGPVVWSGFKFKKQGPLKPWIQAAGGYGFSNQRGLFKADAEIPLIISRWKLDPELNLSGGADDDRKLGPRFKRLSLRAWGEKNSVLFAGDGRRNTRSASAFFYGSDPNQYFERLGWGGRIDARVTRGLVLRAGGGQYSHRPLEQRTGWNVLGRQLRPDGNLAASTLKDGQLVAGAGWTVGPLGLWGDVVWHQVEDSGFVDGLAGSGPGASLDFREIKLGAELDYLDRWGHQWVVRGRHREFDRQTPVQWKTWLGDYGTLRGYQAGELSGDAGSWASADVRLDWDFWRMTHIPVLKNLGMQPIGFADWGKTWNREGPYAVGPEEGAQDYRVDVGFGFGRRFDLPFAGDFRNFRMYAATPVGNGSDGHGWRFLVALEK